MKYSRTLLLCAACLTAGNALAQTQYETAPGWNGSVSIAEGESYTFKNCLFGQTSNLSIDVDGTLTLDLSTGSSPSLATGADQQVTFTGAGTIVKTGTDTLYSANGDCALTIQMEAGGLIDIQNGTLVNGHYQKQYWSSNKGDINLGENGTINLWDGNVVYCDKLTGTGKVLNRDDQTWLKNPIVVGVNNGSSTFDGTFSANVGFKKTGTGTFTLTGANTQKGGSVVSVHVAEGEVHITETGTLAGGGTVQIDENAALTITKSEQYLFNGTLKGAGTLVISGHAFGAFNSPDFTGTIILDNGFLRNNSNDSAYGADIILNGENCGLYSGWAKKSLTINGKITPGTNSTLKIKSDTNTGENASWVVLTNPENGQVDTIVDHYLRITDTGALGTGTVTVNPGKMLDLNGCDFVGTRLASTGIVTNLDTNTLSTVTITAAIANVFQGNIKLIVPDGSTADITIKGASSNTGGAEIGGGIIRLGHQDALGVGTITLNGASLFNSDNSPTVDNKIVLGEKGGGLRVGWNASSRVFTVTGDISGDGQMTFNSGEGNPAYITLAGKNSWTGGTTFANGGGTNYLTLKSSNSLGTGTVDTNGKDVRLTFDTAADGIEMSNPWKIASTGITMQNSAEGTVTLNGSVTGSKNLTISANKGTFVFNGTPASDADAFNVTVQEGAFSGNGTIGGNLTLAAGSSFIMDESSGLGSLTVNGSLTAEGTEFDIVLTGEDAGFAGIHAASVDLTDSIFNVTYTGEVSDKILTFDLLSTQDTAANWENAAFNFMSTNPALMFMQYSDGIYQLTVGSHNALPEPASWTLLLVGLGLFGAVRVRRAREKK